MSCHINEIFISNREVKHKMCPVGKQSYAPDGISNPIIHKKYSNLPAPAGAAEPADEA